MYDMVIVSYHHIVISSYRQDSKEVKYRQTPNAIAAAHSRAPVATLSPTPHSAVAQLLYSNSK